MATLNEVRFIGRLTRDAEARATQSGQQVTKFGAAINRSWKDKNGNWQEETTWVDVTVWPPASERAAQLKKGARVLVSGRLRFEEWTDRQGQQRRQLTVVGERVQPLDRREQTPDAPPPAVTAGMKPQPQQAPPPPPQSEWDDPPF